MMGITLITQNMIEEGKGSLAKDTMDRTQAGQT